MSFRIDGSVTLITGGGTGIGAAVAQVFAEAGSRVVVAGRSREPLEAIARAVGGVAIPVDVCDAQAVDALFDEVQDRFGRIDTLVNNAGQSGPIGPLVDIDLDAWRTCVEVNLFGAMHCMRSAARIMSAQGKGSIINMSSLMGLKGQPMRTAYCATKFALIGMTEALAQEVGSAGVRVNALCPGAVNGELMQRVLTRRAEAEGRPVEEIVAASYTDVAALRRWVEPKEVAYAALFLASDAGSAITGDRMKIDAGRI